MGDPRLRFLKEKHMCESRIHLWTELHLSKQNKIPLDASQRWIYTEPLPETSKSKSRLSLPSSFNVKKRLETLLNQIAIHQSPRPLDHIRQVRAESTSWEKTRADRLFQKRFLGLPGEVRNMIYDELLEHLGGVSQETPLFRSYISGKANHGGAQFRGPLRLPVAHRQNLTFIRQNDPVWNELFDRWCAQVRFYLFEAFEVRLDGFRPLVRSRNKKLRCTLGRYLDTDACQVFGSSSSWFAGMRTCTLSLSLFNIAALLESGAKGLNALRGEIIEVARVMKTATKLTTLHINIRLWPSKYRDQIWKAWPSMANGEEVLACLEPLQDVQGVDRICVFAGSLMASGWAPSRQSFAGQHSKWNTVFAMPDHMEHCIEALDSRRD